MAADENVLPLTQGPKFAELLAIDTDARSLMDRLLDAERRNIPHTFVQGSPCR